MRILVLCYEFPPLGGGGGRAAASLAEQWSLMGHQVRVLTAHHASLPRREEREGVSIRRVRTLRRYADRCRKFEMGAFVVSAIVPLGREVRTFRPDLIHVHFAMPTGPLGWLGKKVWGIPYILTLHGGDVPGFLPEEVDFYHRLLRPVERRILHDASAVVAVCESLRDLARKSFPDLEIRVLPNGVDCDYFRPLPDRPASKAPRILYVGRLTPQKGVKYLLDALAVINSNMKIDFRLEMIGDGPLRSELELQIQQAGLGEKVRFAGWQSREKVREALQQSDVFVMPSEAETLPLVLLEGIACGLPVVGTDILAEFLDNGESGFLVPRGDSDALSRALHRILSDHDLRERMGAAARRRAADFDRRTVAARYMALMQNVLGMTDEGEAA